MLTKEQLLNQLAGKTKVINLEGIGEVEIKSLTFADVEIINSLEEGMQSALQVIKLGLVNPELDDSDLDALRNSDPGKILKIAQSISELSGIESDEDFLETTGFSS